jgi:hypothetical protein
MRRRVFVMLGLTLFLPASMALAEEPDWRGVVAKAAAGNAPAAGTQAVQLGLPTAAASARTSSIPVNTPTPVSIQLPRAASAATQPVGTTPTPGADPFRPANSVVRAQSPEAMPMPSSPTGNDKLAGGDKLVMPHLNDGETPLPPPRPVQPGQPPSPYNPNAPYPYYAGPIGSGGAPLVGGPVVAGPAIPGQIVSTPVSGGCASGACGEAVAMPGAVLVDGPYAGYDPSVFLAGPPVPRNRFWLSGEYLLWWTRTVPGPPLITVGPGASNGILGEPGVVSIVSAGDFYPERRDGGRFRAGYWLDDQQVRGIEGSFFFLGTEGRTAAASTLTFPTVARPFFNINRFTEFSEIVGAPDIGAGSVVASGTTDFWGADINYRRNLVACCGRRIDMIVGFKYLNLDDSINIIEGIEGFNGVKGIVRDSFQAENDFYGGTIGIVGEKRFGRWSLDYRTSVSLGSVRQSIDISGLQSFRSPQFPLGQTFSGGLLALDSNSGSFTRNRFAVVPEVGFNIGYNLTDHIRLFTGYSLIYWNRVVRAPSQIDRNIDVLRIPNFPQPIDTPLAAGVRPVAPFKETDFWAQGLNFGVEFRW